MISLFKKQPTGTEITFKIDGMHCTGCAMNIDGALEDTEGVISAATNYAKSETTIIYDPVKVTIPLLKKVINELEYTVSES